MAVVSTKKLFEGAILHGCSSRTKIRKKYSEQI